MSLPILYSFRRCPYAIRARHALASTGQQVTLREVVLRDKPACMLERSAKGTVPVLVMTTGEVIDESLDIMRWALHSSDPEGWMEPYKTQAEDVDALIARNDGEFKHHLDRYKYTNRYEGADSRQHRDAAEGFLADLNARLSDQSCLFSEHMTLADAAILPFIRQFANADRSWFDSTPYPQLHRWLRAYLDSAEFQALMVKVPQWQPGDEETVFA